MTQIPDYFTSTPPGWRKILERLHKDLLTEDENYSVKFLEERFGMLRLGLVEENPTIWMFIAGAEDRSGFVCGLCGSLGYTTNVNGKFVARCSTHDPKNKTRG